MRRQALWCDRQMLKRCTAARRSNASPCPAGLYQPDWSQRGWFGVPTVGCFTLDTSLPIPPEPAWAWPDLSAAAVCCTRLYGSYCPKHTHTDCIREKNRVRQELWKHALAVQAENHVHHMLDPKSDGENWRETERDREGKSYNLFSVCDCISVRLILFFTHVTQKHTQTWSP